MSEQNEDININSKTGNIKKKLLAFVGILVVIPSIINAVSDIYNSIMNIPIGDSEVINSKLMQTHWEEYPLFKKDIEIKDESVSKLLKLRVYKNADIWVKYGKKDQWLPSEKITNSSIYKLAPFPMALAKNIINFKVKDQPHPVLTKELEPVTVDLQEIQSEKESILSVESSKIIRTYLFAETNDSHSLFSPSTKKYIKTYQAEDGLIFTEANLDILSINNAKHHKINISQDKKTITVEAELQSGPIYDRWRGWMKAEVVTKQERIE